MGAIPHFIQYSPNISLAKTISRAQQDKVSEQPSPMC